jgi:hypothetical protein
MMDLHNNESGLLKGTLFFASLGCMAALVIGRIAKNNTEQADLKHQNQM